MHRRLFSATQWLRCAAASQVTSQAPQAAAASDSDPPTPAADEAPAPPKSLPEAVASLPFRSQMVELKRAYRGIAQRPSSLHDAKVVLDRNIPTDKADLAAWLDEENAMTALNGASFFEIGIPSQPAIVEWTKSHLHEFKQPFNVANAALSILHLEAHSEECVAFLTKTAVPLLRDNLAELVRDSFHTAVKLFQRLKVEEAELWEKVCAEIKRREVEISQRDANAVRLFSCVARHAPENPVTAELFGFLVDRVGGMKSYDFTTFLSGAERWGKLSLENALPLLQRQGERTHQNNARDLGVCFPAAVRIGRALEAQSPSEADRLRLAQHLHFVFDACETHVLRCMDRTSVDFYWEKPSDVIMALYAYETSNRNAPQLYKRFAEYCAEHIAQMTGRDVAMSLGIQRRAGVLSNAYVDAVLPTVRAALEANAVTLEEVSHIQLSLVSLSAAGASTPLASEIKAYVKKHFATASNPTADVIFGGQSVAKATTCANLSVVLADATFVSEPLTDVPVRQLVDLRRFGTNAAGVERINKELAQRIASHKISDGELSLVALSATKPEDVLRRPAQAIILELLQRQEWGPYHLDLLAASTKLDKSSYVRQAVELARLLAVSPQQCVFAIRKLLPIFSGDQPELTQLVAEAAEQLLRSSLSYSIELIRATKGTTAHRMSPQWLSRLLTTSCVRHASRAPPEDIAEVLDAIRAQHKASPGAVAALDDASRAAVTEIVAAQTTRAGLGKSSATGLAALVASLTALDAKLVTPELQKEAVAVAAKQRAVSVKPAPAQVAAPSSSKTAAAPAKRDVATPAAAAAAAAKPSGGGKVAPPAKGKPAAAPAPKAAAAEKPLAAPSKAAAAPAKSAAKAAPAKGKASAPAGKAKPAAKAKKGK